MTFIEKKDGHSERRDEKQIEKVDKLTESSNNMPQENCTAAAPIHIHEVREIGYHPVVDYGAWRVAVLNYIDELLPENIDNVQQHSETDEVFVLLSGQCILFTAEVEGENVHDIRACPMDPGKIYNVPKGVYHTHTLRPGTAVLIVENSDTGDNNSPKVELSPENRAELMRLSEELLAPKGE